MKNKKQHIYQGNQIYEAAKVNQRLKFKNDMRMIVLAVVIILLLFLTPTIVVLLLS